MQPFSQIVRSMVIFWSMVAIVSSLPSTKGKKDNPIDVPPPPRHAGYFDSKQNREEIAERLNNWKPEDENNIWELSGHYEGDIMTIEETTPEKNGLLDEQAKWTDGIVPYYIDKEDFTDEQIKQIEAAIGTYHAKTCIRFRSYVKTDADYLRIKSDNTGCWSYVGKHADGQVVNFQNPGCMRHGTIIHELLHALGFHHQQSAADRDDWIEIKWANIEAGREHNFNKYDGDTVTDFGVGYDYGSVMHYSAKAFSKNGKKTIVPRKQNVTLGQRSGFSEKDILKLNAMYKTECESRDKREKDQTDKDSKDDVEANEINP